MKLDVTEVMTMPVQHSMQHEIGAGAFSEMLRTVMLRLSVLRLATRDLGPVGSGRSQGRF